MGWGELLMAQMSLFGKETKEIKPKRKPDKVEILIEPGHHYDKSCKNGAEFTSVGFSARQYGGCGGCDSEEEIKSSVKNYKEWIMREGDIPVVKDMREVTELEKEK